MAAFQQVFLGRIVRAASHVKLFHRFDAFVSIVDILKNDDCLQTWIIVVLDSFSDFILDDFIQFSCYYF
jgi:hypothetical protein